MMSDEDEIERKEVADTFLSLSIEEQYHWVNGVVYLGLLSEEKKRSQRFWANKKKKNYEWISYPNEQELMLVGGLDREEAESLYNRSQGYKCVPRLGRIERRKFQEMMMGLTVEDDDDDLRFMMEEQQSDDEGASSEAKSNQTDEGAIRKINCYDDQGRKELVEMVKSYRMKLEEMKQMLKKRKTVA